MSKEKLKTVFEVYYYDDKGNILDQTQIDEEDEVLAKELFVEFGHNIDDLKEIYFEEVFEDE